MSNVARIALTSRRQVKWPRVGRPLRNLAGQLSNITGGSLVYYDFIEYDGRVFIGDSGPTGTAYIVATSLITNQAKRLSAGTNLSGAGHLGFIPNGSNLYFIQWLGGSYPQPTFNRITQGSDDVAEKSDAITGIGYFAGFYVSNDGLTASYTGWDYNGYRIKGSLSDITNLASDYGYGQSGYGYTYGQVAFFNGKIWYGQWSFLQQYTTRPFGDFVSIQTNFTTAAAWATGSVNGSDQSNAYVPAKQKTTWAPKLSTNVAGDSLLLWTDNNRYLSYCLPAAINTYTTVALPQDYQISRYDPAMRIDDGDYSFLVMRSEKRQSAHLIAFKHSNQTFYYVERLPNPAKICAGNNTQNLAWWTRVRRLDDELYVLANVQPNGTTSSQRQFYIQRLTTLATASFPTLTLAADTTLWDEFDTSASSNITGTATTISSNSGAAVGWCKTKAWLDGNQQISGQFLIDADSGSAAIAIGFVADDVADPGTAMGSAGCYAYRSDGTQYKDATTQSGATFTAGDNVEFFLDLGTGKLQWAKNGTNTGTEITTVDMTKSYRLFVWFSAIAGTRTVTKKLHRVTTPAAGYCAGVPLETGAFPKLDAAAYTDGYMFFLDDARKYWKPGYVGGTYPNYRTTRALSGKGYIEFVFASKNNNTSGIRVGILQAGLGQTEWLGNDAGGLSYGYSTDGKLYFQNVGANYGSTWSAFSIFTIGLAWEDTGSVLKVWFRVNGTWQASGDPVLGTNPAMQADRTVSWFPAVWFHTWSENDRGRDLGAEYSRTTLNFGQVPFKYAPPAGFDTWLAPA